VSDSRLSIQNRKKTGSEQEVIQPMETQQGRANKEPRLCFVRRREGLIERATWVKNVRKGSLLVVRPGVTTLIATGPFGKRGQ